MPDPSKQGEYEVHAPSWARNADVLNVNLRNFQCCGISAGGACLVMTILQLWCL